MGDRQQWGGIDKVASRGGEEVKLNAHNTQGGTVAKKARERKRVREKHGRNMYKTHIDFIITQD